MWKRDEKRKPLFVKPHRVRKTFYALLILAAASGVIRYGILPVVWRVQANSLARQFEKSPSDQLAVKLAAMMDRRAFSKKRGGEVLELLMRPEIAVREAYPLEIRPLFKLIRRLCLFHEYGMTEERWRVDWTGVRKDQGSSAWTPVNPTASMMGMPGAKALLSHSLLSPRPRETGEYVHTEGFHLSLYAIERKLKFGKPPWPRQGLMQYVPFWIETLPLDTTGSPVYETEFEVPISFSILPEEQVNELTHVSDPELDAAMKASISSATTNSTWSVFMKTGTILKGHGDYLVTFTNPPENAAFMMFFRDETGREHKLCDSVFDAFYVHAGENGQYRVPMPHIVTKLDTPSHRGTLIFRTDLDAAYADPEIKTVWDGELEVPIEWE